MSSPTQRTLEPPISEEGSPLGDLGLMATGVRGYAVQVGDEIFIPMIEADNPGNGDVGRFLDALSVRCRIVNVMSPTLSAMLTRRGWRKEYRNIDTPDGPETVDVWSTPQ